MTIKRKVFKGIAKAKKGLTCEEVRNLVFIAQGEKPHKRQGYYCVAFQKWESDGLITRINHIYKLTSLGKLYIKNPKEANQKIRMRRLKQDANWYRQRCYSLQREINELQSKIYNIKRVLYK